ncbi:GTPase domain-containing protein [Pseudosporangium ferrugineum]|uniref:50S ribosome-binding GTPase n=1 Tax=Pseudosporangium ferrugineum TaxID=439699 RepID=A0A2T0RI18_9ACTN|nr:GTPase domain-containing protein [Pseudosporangium ferrugineum]PRY20815.1 50S ribosome-binding GTPase [Pseudosporangium ferrugineum]
MSAEDGLAGRVHEVLAEAMRIYHDSPRAQEWLHRHAVRLDGPLLLAVAGPSQAGKSTLVNALIGESVAPVRSRGQGGHPAWYRDGPQPRAQVRPRHGAPYELPVHRAEQGLQLADSLRPYEAAEQDGEIHEVHVEWPSRSLRHTHVYDTPGLPPGDDGWLRAARMRQEADAVLFLSRTLASADLHRLPPARGGWAAATLPLHHVVVLSRADETAGGRVDAMLAAKQIARRRRHEPDLTMLCQDVLAVSGLLGYAARSLRQDEFDALAVLAGSSRAELEPYLLSVDRFRAAGEAIALEPAWRERLLDRLTLTGVKLATTLVRSGARDPSALAEALLRHSGLAELQVAITDLFSARRTVLKARTALIAVEQLAHREPRPQSGHLLVRVEQTVSAAHEFRELRLLAALRARRAGLPGELAVEGRRLVGGEGGTLVERLGLPAEAPPDEIRAHAAAAADRWRVLAQQPDRTGQQMEAAQTVLRSCEAMLQQLP